MKISDAIKIKPRELIKHRKILSLSLVFILVVASFAGGARNASANYYSSYCLGGWQNPQLSGGQPSLEEDANQADFTGLNSSVLENSLASIFCGYFQAPQMEDSPKEVRARFSWYVDFGTSLTEVPVEPETVLPEVVEGEAPAPIEEDDSSSEAGSEPISNPVNPPPAAPEESPVIPAPVEDESEPAEAPEPQPEPELPVETPVVEESSVSEPVSDSISEILLRNFTIPVARAQESESYGFAQIKYSFNGRDWSLISTVSAGNWKNLSVAVPVDTWEEVQNLQIAVVPMQTIDTQPVIYLDGIWIEVDYRQSLVEAVQEAAEDTMALMEDVVDGIAGIFGAEEEVTQVAGSDPEVEENIVVADVPETGEIAGLEISGASEEKATLSFKLAGDLSPTLRILPWMSRNDLKDLGENFDMLNKASPKFVTDPQGSLISVSGGCQMQYYVLLIFENALDYAERPGEFVLNQAEACDNRNYSIELYESLLPVKPGSYHMLVAEQELDSVWSPITPLIPITVSQNP